MFSNSIRNVQMHCLKILKEAIRICEFNNIQYYLVGGSALGAYRHKGFIPWDDDIDIAIPRSQYQQFINACQEHLDPQFYLQDFSVDQKFIFPFAKIRLNHTAHVEKDLEHIDMHHGIFIDVFPLDNIPDCKIGRFVQKNGLKVCNAIRLSKLDLKSPSVLKNIILFLLKQFFPTKYLPDLYTYFMQISGKRNTSHIGNLVGAYIYEKESMEKGVFGKGQLLKFEGIYCRVPVQIERFLEGVYGPTYMELPPEGERKTHNAMLTNFSHEYHPTGKKK